MSSVSCYILSVPHPLFWSVWFYFWTLVFPICGPSLRFSKCVHHHSRQCASHRGWFGFLTWLLECKRCRIRRAGAALKAHIWRVSGFVGLRSASPVGAALDCLCSLHHPCCRYGSWLIRTGVKFSSPLSEKTPLLWEQVVGGVHSAAGLRTRIGEEMSQTIRTCTDCYQDIY